MHLILECTARTVATRAVFCSREAHKPDDGVGYGEDDDEDDDEGLHGIALNVGIIMKCPRVPYFI